MTQWSKVLIKEKDDVYQYQTVAPLGLSEAKALQQDLIARLGTTKSNGDHHKSFPCSLGVIGFDQGESQCRVTMFATEAQFNSLFPAAELMPDQQNSIAI